MENKKEVRYIVQIDDGSGYPPVTFAICKELNEAVKIIRIFEGMVECPVYRLIREEL